MTTATTRMMTALELAPRQGIWGRDIVSSRERMSKATPTMLRGASEPSWARVRADGKLRKLLIH